MVIVVAKSAATSGGGMRIAGAPWWLITGTNRAMPMPNIADEAARERLPQDDPVDVAVGGALAREVTGAVIDAFRRRQA
jgi:hypothetical protein